MQHQQVKLKNNLETLFVHNPGTTAGTVQIWFRAGSALEEHSNEGIAHFLEHMFFKGTETRPGAKIAHEVESFGGEINAFTSFDYTCYYINTPSHELEKTVEILLDMVSNPMFKQDDLVPERDVVFEEYRRSVDSPNHYSFHKLQSLCFEGGYKHPIIGREETIKNFSREQLKDFRQKFYNLSNAMLVVAGNITNRESLEKIIEKYKMPNGPASHFPEFKISTKSGIDIHQKEVRMLQLTIALQSPEYTSDEGAAEDLAMNCLGYGESSRLYKKLVLESTTANSASASTMFMNKGGAHFLRVSFPFENIDKVFNELFNTLSGVIHNGVQSSEVQKIKNQYIASKVYEMESVESYAFSLGHSYAQGGAINCEEEFIQRLKKTSATAVNHALKQIFTRPSHFSMQIPQNIPVSKVEKKVAALQKKFSQLAKDISKHNKQEFKITTSKHDAQAKLYHIKPGIDLLYRQNTMCPTFVLHAYVRGGLTEETVKTNGIYNLLANVLTKGYDKISYDKLKLNLEDRSASLHGFAGKNAYGILMHGQSEHMGELAQMFKGALLRPDIPQKYLKHDVQLTLRALENQKEDPVKKCFQEAGKLFFDKHPYAFNILGTKENVKKFTQKQLLKTHHDNLKKQKILLTYCGDLPAEDILEHLKDLFEVLPARKVSKLKFKSIKPIVGQDKFYPFNREQTQIFYGVPTGKMGTMENIYLKMLTTHLSGQSSELFVEVRDRQGLCYSAQPVHFAALEGGYFGIYMASGHDKVPRAIDAIKNLIEKYRTSGLSIEDFERIKLMLKGQNLINVQTNEDYAGIYAVPVLQDQGIDYFYQNEKKIAELTHDEFQREIKKILSRKWNLIVVGKE